jgi:hypothetical protein
VLVSGWVLRAQYLYLRDRGRGAFEQVQEKLSESTKEFLRGGFLETRWYPLELFLELAETADVVLGKGDHGIALQMGRFSCEHALSSAYRLLFKFGDVGHLLDRASTAWATNFDEGEIEVRRTQGGTIVLDLVRLREVAETACWVIKGWMERAAELSGEDRFECTMQIAPEEGVLCRWRFAWPRRRREI